MFRFPRGKRARRRRWRRTCACLSVTHVGFNSLHAGGGIVADNRVLIAGGTRTATDPHRPCQRHAGCAPAAVGSEKRFLKKKNRSWKPPPTERKRRFSPIATVKTRRFADESKAHGVCWRVGRRRSSGICVERQTFSVNFTTRNRAKFHFVFVLISPVQIRKHAQSAPEPI